MASSASGSEARIDKLPAELTVDVMNYLRPHDLTKLARVSKRYREFAQSTLWRNIELHRRDAHHNCFTLSAQKAPRLYLDDKLRDAWSYRHYDGTDHDFDRHNARFGTAVRRLYKTAGKSEAWGRLAPLVRHLCLTVTHASPPRIWDIILSLPNLRTIEVIGECSLDRLGPPPATSLRQPIATNVQNIRLRGYIPAVFVVAICKASASSIVCLDLGVLEAPKVYMEYDDEGGPSEEEREYPLYVRPRGVIWYDASSWPQFTSLSRLLLCKPGLFDAPPDMSEEEDSETRDDPEHEILELAQWGSLLRAVHSTAVEIVLEHRPVYLDYLLDWDPSISPHDDVDMSPGPQFRQMVVKSAFAEEDWPNLEQLTFRGMAPSGHDFSEAAERTEHLKDFAAKMLPGVKVNQVPGDCMFFNTRKGTILNQYGADGLKAHLEPDIEDEYGNTGFLF